MHANLSAQATRTLARSQGWWVRRARRFWRSAAGLSLLPGAPLAGAFSSAFLFAAAVSSPSLVCLPSLTLRNPQTQSARSSPLSPPARCCTHSQAPHDLVPASHRICQPHRLPQLPHSLLGTSRNVSIDRRLNSTPRDQHRALDPFRTEASKQLCTPDTLSQRSRCGASWEGPGRSTPPTPRRRRLPLPVRLAPPSADSLPLWVPHTNSALPPRVRLFH